MKSAAERSRRGNARATGRLWPVVVAGCLLLLGPLSWDLSRPPEAQQTARWMLSGIALYQVTLSPLLGKGGLRCRFRPSCSHYAAAVIRRDGALEGGSRAIWRVMRCGPWTPPATLDAP